MVNGLGVLGWASGIEAEAAMLGQPLLDAPSSRRRPAHLRGVAGSTTATDVVLTVTELLRHHGVVARSSSATDPGWAPYPSRRGPPSAT